MTSSFLIFHGDILLHVTNAKCVLEGSVIWLVVLTVHMNDR